MSKVSLSVGLVSPSEHEYANAGVQAPATQAWPLPQPSALSAHLAWAAEPGLLQVDRQQPTRPSPLGSSSLSSRPSPSESTSR